MLHDNNVSSVSASINFRYVSCDRLWFSWNEMTKSDFCEHLWGIYNSSEARELQRLNWNVFSSFPDSDSTRNWIFRKYNIHNACDSICVNSVWRLNGRELCTAICLTFAYAQIFEAWDTLRTRHVQKVLGDSLIYYITTGIRIVQSR